MRVDMIYEIIGNDFENKYLSPIKKKPVICDVKDLPF